MNTTVKALQALYIKLGGALTDTYETIADGAPVGNYNTIPDMIEACTQKAGSGGGSGGAMILHGTMNEEDLTVAITEEYSEYSAAYDDGQVVFIEVMGSRLPLVSCSNTEDGCCVMFAGVILSDDIPSPISISYDNDTNPPAAGAYVFKVSMGGTE